MNDWHLVDSLISAASRASLEVSFNLPFQETDSTEDSRFFTARGQRLDNAPALTQLDVRVRKDTDEVELVIAAIQNTGITLAAARERYPDLHVSEILSTPSFEDTTTFSCEVDTGFLSLGFEDERQGRLVRIAFAPRVIP